MPQAYPLSWPEGWRRTPRNERKNGHFNKKERITSQGFNGQTQYWTRNRNLTVADAVDRVLRELGSMGIDRQDVIISTNVRVRLDGLPRSGERAPEDPGAAVYWKERNKPMRCMATDRYTAVEDNLAAIAATLDAMRAIERHGGAQILDRAFTGFAALPERASSPWREVLEMGTLSPNLDEVELQFKNLARRHHPDVGGDPDKFRQLVQARDDARRDLGGAA